MKTFHEYFDKLSTSFFTNARMDGALFVHSWSIRGWSRMAKVNALREPNKGVILQVKGREELRPFFGRTLTLSPNEVSGMPSVLDSVFRGESR